MIYESAEEQVKQSRQEQETIMHLAEVTSVDAQGRARIKFYGDEEESGKTYSYIDGYIPAVGDKVLMAKQGNTFVILGAVTLKQVIVKYSLKDHKHDDTYVSQETYDAHTHEKLVKGKLSLQLNGDSEILPGANGSYDLGNSDYRFANGYINNLIATYLTLGGEKLELEDFFGKVIGTPGADIYIELDGGNFIPYSNRGISLGSTSKMFNNVHAMAYYENGIRVYPYRLNSTTTSSTKYVELNGSVLKPNSSGTIDVGSSSYQYKNVYAQNVYVNGSAVTTSDKRKKKFIKNLQDKYIELFKKLRPVSFKYKKGTSGRTHAGFIAQEVEQAMQECDISNEEFGGLVIQENGEYGLRYEEFIALQTAVIQDLLKRVEELERRVKA